MDPPRWFWCFPCSCSGTSLDTDFPLGLSVVLWLTPSGFPWFWGELNHWTMKFFILVAVLTCSPASSCSSSIPHKHVAELLSQTLLLSGVGDAAQWVNLGHHGKSEINVLWDSADMILHWGWRKWQLNQGKEADKLFSPFSFCRRMWTSNVIFPFAFSLLV